MQTIYIILKDQISTETYRQKATDIYKKYENKLYFIVNPATNLITIEICPFVELSY